MRLRISDGFFARDDIPFAPRRNNFQFGTERFRGEFEAHLVVTFSGAAMGERVRANCLCELHLPLGENGARKRRAQQIFMLVDRSGAQRRPDILRDEFLAQIFDVRGACAGGESLFARRLEIFLLAEVADHGDHFATAVILLQPRNNDGGVQPSGICQHNFLRQFVLLGLCKQRVQNRLLNVKAIFGLIVHDGASGVDHSLADF